jgi:uncharacterized protein with HEPN domain
MRSDGEQIALRDIFHHIDLAQHFCLDQTYQSFSDDYEDVAARRVWDTVQVALPPLKAAVEQELGD